MMSVLPSDVRFYGAAAMAEADGVTQGGAVDTTVRVTFADLAASGTYDYVSSSASDTGVVLTVKGRDTTGVIQSEGKTLTGTTKVAGSQIFERALSFVATATAAVGDIAALSHTAVIAGHTAQGGAAQSATASANVTLQSGDGAGVSLGDVFRPTNNTPSGVNFQLREAVAISGDVVSVNRDWSTVPTSGTTYDIYTGALLEILPNPVKKVIRFDLELSADAAGGSAHDFYSKFFAVNNNISTALTLGAVSLQSIAPSLPSGATLGFALCNALNNTDSITTRKDPGSPPTNITAYQGSGGSISVPGAGNLPSGAAPNAAGAQGIWTSLHLAAGTAAYKGAATFRNTGSTT